MEMMLNKQSPQKKNINLNGRNIEWKTSQKRVHQYSHR